MYETVEVSDVTGMHDLCLFVNRVISQGQLNGDASGFFQLESGRFSLSNERLIVELRQETLKSLLAEGGLRDFLSNCKPFFELQNLSQIKTNLQTAFFARFVHFSTI